MYSVIHCIIACVQIATAASRGQCVGYLALSMVIGSLMSVLLFYLLEVQYVV